MLKIQTLKCINYLDVLYALQEQECDELGITKLPPGYAYVLPDGRSGIKERLWDELREDQYGNQQFNNDSFYRVVFDLDSDGVVYEDYLSDDIKKLLHYCRDALNDDGAGTAFLLFDVCW
jgi:hypothetical protein